MSKVIKPIFVILAILFCYWLGWFWMTESKVIENEGRIVPAVAPSLIIFEEE